MSMRTIMIIPAINGRVVPLAMKGIRKTIREHDSSRRSSQGEDASEQILLKIAANGSERTLYERIIESERIWAHETSIS
jgi:hypothetical protein